MRRCWVWGVLAATLLAGCQQYIADKVEAEVPSDPRERSTNVGANSPDVPSDVHAMDNVHKLDATVGNRQEGLARKKGD